MLNVLCWNSTLSNLFSEGIYNHDSENITGNITGKFRKLNFHIDFSKLYLYQ